MVRLPGSIFGKCICEPKRGSRVFCQYPFPYVFAIKTFWAAFADRVDNGPPSLWGGGFCHAKASQCVPRIKDMDFWTLHRILYGSWFLMDSFSRSNHIRYKRDILLIRNDRIWDFYFSFVIWPYILWDGKLNVLPFVMFYRFNLLNLPNELLFAHS